MAYCLQSKILPTLAVLIIGLFTNSCREKVVSAEAEADSQDLVMYQPSEMAKLMNEFYSYNEDLKKAILNDDSLLVMPEKFKDIHTATMTNPNGRTPVFNSFAPAYLEVQQQVFDTMSDIDLKSRFNNTINMCIACHKTECVGPIPRIKKLLID